MKETRTMAVFVLCAGLGCDEDASIAPIDSDSGADAAPDASQPEVGADVPKDLPTRLGPVRIAHNVLVDDSTDWRGFGLGISLFYAPSVPRAEYEDVIDELAGVGIEIARFSGSTFTWGNEEGRPEVNPFLPGEHPFTPDDPEVGGFTNEPNPAFFDELESRLDYAAEHGIRVQYTLLWGGFQPMFIRAGDPPALHRASLRRFVDYAAERLARHPEHTVEIINEADHPYHMAGFGRQGRIDALREIAGWIREAYPDALLSVSDGGREPESEGAPYFDYHEIAELDYWNVHFPRDEVFAEGIPRWARGVWHLYSDRNAFADAHEGRTYGRNDENMFLQTEADHERWPYRSSTRDWRMYGNMMWVSLAAGVGFTLHTQKGFFCYPGLTSDPIFEVVRAMRAITTDFPWQHARSFNASWVGSPVPSYDGPFKAFSLVAQDGTDVLIHVLNPAGTLTLELDHEGMHGVCYDSITGTVLSEFDPPAGVSTLRLPDPMYEHAMTIRIRRE